MTDLNGNDDIMLYHLDLEDDSFIEGNLELRRMFREYKQDAAMIDMFDSLFQTAIASVNQGFELASEIETPDNRTQH